MGTVRCSNHLGVCVCLPLVRGGVCPWSRGVSAFGLRGCLALVRGREGVWLWSQGSVCLRSQGSVHPLGRHLPGRHLLGCTPTQCMLGYIPLPSAYWDTHQTCQVHAGIHPTVDRMQDACENITFSQRNCCCGR